ncbi:MAG: ACP S-malonyltransferase [Gammaproteobacteria bacterium]|nr:ACP S-malonyltransferase [Gammaproteobacteria bacterium]MCW8927752.1 ACP S-malonyltransferase [Gammaproteobacteria bacterium]MCW8958236.1 ACP S-malonyltransferase [Gammaproteobacteria bacterium]MCW8973383.1 ACP S-malonyltransferase [Gammaproteobacteria bacterium]
MSLAFVFPGQGSQAVGMLAELAEVESQVKTTFAEASETLGYDLWKIASEGPAEELNQTHITQPAMLSAGIAVWRIWQEKGGAVPAVMAGHSLGEYSALVAAGSLGFADAISLVAERGKLMQEAVPAGTGSMAAILGLDDTRVIQVCEQAAGGEVVSAVNFNANGQVVIAGQVAAVERAVSLAKEAGAKRAVILPVSVPSHCALMKPAADKLAERLAGISISAPQIPVINNADVSKATDVDAIRDALVRQLYSPVRWVETVQAMEGEGVDTLIECGPGKVLTGLNKRIVKGMMAMPVFDPAGLEKALSELA